MLTELTAHTPRTGVGLCIASFLGVPSAEPIEKQRVEFVYDEFSGRVAFQDTVFIHNHHHAVHMQPELATSGTTPQDSILFLLSDQACAVYDAQTGHPLVLHQFGGLTDKKCAIIIEDNVAADTLTVSNEQPIRLENGLTIPSAGFRFVRSCILDPHWRHYAVYTNAQERRMYMQPFIAASPSV